MFLYLIRNTVTEKIYIGKTVQSNLNSYFKHNLRNAERGQNDKRYLYASIRKHGRSAFTIKEICHPESESLLCALERWYIGFYKSNDSSIGYNLTAGGDGVSGLKQSDFSKEKLRQRSIGNTWRRGKKFSDESKKLLQESVKKSFKEGRTVWNKNKPWSDDARRKMSESAKLRWINITPDEINNYKLKGHINALKRWASDERQQFDSATNNRGLRKNVS